MKKLKTKLKKSTVLSLKNYDYYLQKALPIFENHELNYNYSSFTLKIKKQFEMKSFVTIEIDLFFYDNKCEIGLSISKKRKNLDLKDITGNGEISGLFYAFNLIVALSEYLMERYKDKTILFYAANKRLEKIYNHYFCRKYATGFIKTKQYFHDEKTNYVCFKKIKPSKYD